MNEDFTNGELEETLVGCFIADFDGTSKVFNAFDSNSLHRPDLRTICENIADMRANGLAVDLPALSSILSNDLFATASFCAAKAAGLSSRAQTYATSIENLARRRRAIVEVNQARDILINPEAEIDAALDAIDTLRSGLLDTGTRHEVFSEADIMSQALMYIEQRANGQIKSIPTGLKALDNLTGGLFRGELAIIGARPATGKSAFAQHMARAAARAGFNVLFDSEEMSGIQLGLRSFANIAHVDGMHLRRGDLDAKDWEELASALSDANPRLHLVFNTRTIEDLFLEAQRAKSRNELDVLFVDYAQLISSKKRFDSRYLEVGHVSRELKRLALELDIAVIALAQTNRAADEQRAPTLSNLRESGDLEQNADMILFLHFPSSADDFTVNPKDRNIDPAFFTVDGANGQRYLSILVGKNRQGSVGTASCFFRTSDMSYLDIQR